MSRDVLLVIFSDTIHWLCMVWEDLLLSDSDAYTDSSSGSRICPRRERQLPREGHQHMNLPNFNKNCMRLKDFGHPGGGRAPLRSATGFGFEVFQIHPLSPSVDYWSAELAVFSSNDTFYK